MKNRTAQRTALSLAISTVLAYPGALQALGLGELHSSSQLNQPLNAQIDLLSTNAKEAGQLQVRLASSDVFSRVGIDRPGFLDSLKFTPTMQNGKPVIRVTSDTPISEPFLNFLLEVSWPQGQLLKEYTVLLDPPVLMNTGSATTENAAAVRAEPQSAGVINRGQDAERQRQLAQQQQQRQRQLEIQRQQQAQANQRQQQFEAQAQAVLADDTPATQSSTGSTKYRVRSGDTMGRIASRLRYRGVSNNQMMVALFRANPNAFIRDNINYLKSGALLNKPSKTEVRKSSSAESRKIINQHYTQWKKYRSGLAGNTVAQSVVQQGSSGAPDNVSQMKGTDKANLKVAGTDGDQSKPSNQISASGNAELQKELTLAQEALASSKSENAELQSRVSQLEAIIRKKDRLITLKNDRLAKLETQLGSGVSDAAIPAAPISGAVEADVNESTDLATQVGNQAEQNKNRIMRGDGGENAPENQAETAVTQVDVNAALDNANEEEGSNPFVVENKTDSKGGILELLSSPLVAAIGGGGLLALLLGWFLMRRSSTSPEDEIIEENTFEESDDDNFFDEESVSPARPIESDEFDVNEPDHGASEPLFSEESTDGSDAIDSILSGDDPLEDDEILQEADVYIVYGLHEQAEDELKKAISNNPGKLEYRYKLLENYKAANDPESFVASSKDFLKAAASQADADNAQPLWENIVSWGKEVAPENELFSEASVKSAAGMTAGVAGLDAATQVAKEAFADDFSETIPPELGTTAGLDITGVDGDIDVGTDTSMDVDFDLGDDLGIGDDLDLGDDFGLDELANEIDTNDNVLSFGSPESSGNENDDLTSVNLEIDQDSGLDKILPAGNSYTSDSSDTNESNDDNLDDALSFLDLSDDDEEVQQAHISTKLDLARAYLDMGDVEGARHTLEEVVIEGNDDQKREAEELLQQTG